MFFKPNPYILGQTKCVWRGNLSRKNYFSTYLKGTLACEIFWSSFCTDQTYIGQIIRLLSVFSFVLEFADLFKFFNIRQWLSWCRVSFPINWVNAKWDSMSTESMQNDEIFVNVGAFCIGSVAVEAHSSLTHLGGSLTPRWLSWQGVSLTLIRHI